MEPYKEQVITTSDKQNIVARFFYPKDIPKASVIIAPGMGTPQNYFRHLAQNLAEKGYLTVTFDYRGTGLSRIGSLRGFKADIFDWTRKDCAAVINTVAAINGDHPIYWLGHSLGGQIAGLVPNINKVSKIITIAAGSGYWRENAPQLKKHVLWLWYFFVPLFIAIFGYFPGKRFNMVGDLPKGVILQWRRWCLNPNYLIGVEGKDVADAYKHLTIPIVSFAISDDELISVQAVKSLHRFYASAPKTLIEIFPQNHGLKHIRHLGFFKPERKALWETYLYPLLQF